MDNAKIKHLEFIQNVISRMGQNSFLIKGWCITIISALIAIVASEGCSAFLLISIFPIVVFWLLDSYYLQQERKFRLLYDDACHEEFPLFLMQTDKKVRYFSVFFSKSILLLYLPMILMIIILYFVF